MHSMLHLTYQYISPHSLQSSLPFNECWQWQPSLVTHALVMMGNTAAVGKHSKALSTVVHTNCETSSFRLSTAEWRAQSHCQYSVYDQTLKLMKNCLVFIRSWYWDISWVSSVTNAGTVLQNRLQALLHPHSSIHLLGNTEVEGKKYSWVVSNGN